MSSYDRLALQAAQRAKGYWLLSRLLLEMPTDRFLEELDGMLSTSGEVDLLPELAAFRAAVRDTRNDSEAAAVAFTRQFTLGEQKSAVPLPFEAHVLEGRHPGARTEKVAAAMHEAGFGDVAVDAPSPDHLGAELRFMSLLCYREYEAWEAENHQIARDALLHQRDLHVSHLQPWAPGYCRRSIERTDNVYIRALCELTAKTIEDDLQVLSEIISWVAPIDQRT